MKQASSSLYHKADQRKGLADVNQTLKAYYDSDTISLFIGSEYDYIRVAPGPLDRVPIWNISSQM
jgi:hypothetical protein